MKQSAGILIALATFLLGIGIGTRYGALQRDTALPPAHHTSADSEIGHQKRQTFPDPEPRTFGHASSPEPQSVGDGPTPEELAAISELKRRSLAGEYVLPSDNPFTVRKRREHIERTLEAIVPPIISARQGVLSQLGVGPESITRLTNHAARIAEASSALMPLLAELATAKAQYDMTARRCLTPEQYESFKEFETRQVLEAEWKPFGVSSLDSLPFDDVAGIMRSMQDLGIRETQSSTTLPFAAEPKGGIIHGEQVDQYTLSQIGRLEAAAEDLSEVADRNNLSTQARGALAAMIEERAESLRKRMEAVAKLDEEHRARVKKLAPRSD